MHAGFILQQTPFVQRWKMMLPWITLLKEHSSFTSRMSSSFSSRNSSNDCNGMIKFLDLRGSGLSILERLCLEECLYRIDTTNHWIIVGYHEATPHRYFTNHYHPSSPTSVSSTTAPNHTVKPIHSKYNNKNEDNCFGDDTANPHVAIVLGLGGKPENLLNINQVMQDNVMCIKRFSGGGTVVLDVESIWTTIIGRPVQSTSHDQSSNENRSNVTTIDDSTCTTNTTMFYKGDFYPRPIMQ